MDIIDLKARAEQNKKIAEAAKPPEGPKVSTFRFNYTDGTDEEATGILVTTSAFIAVGNPS